MRLGRDPPRDADVRMSFAQQPGTAADRWDVGRVTIDVLPDVALLEIFGCYMNQVREECDGYLELEIEELMAYAGARVSKMAIRCFWFAASPESPTSLHRRNTS